MFLENKGLVTPEAVWLGGIKSMSADGVSDNTLANRGTIIASRLAISCTLMEKVGRIFAPMPSNVARPVFAARSMGVEDDEIQS
jgi:uncharacterized protein (DUF362 family)